MNARRALDAWHMDPSRVDVMRQIFGDELVGTYACVTQNATRQSDVECPYCHERMLRVTAEQTIRIEIVQTVGWTGANGVGTTIPDTCEVYACKPCRQMFTVDRAQRASLTAET